MKKKLLILTDTMKPMVDGVSSFLTSTVPYLTQKYEVTIIATHYSDETYEGAELITYPVLKLFTSVDYGIPKPNRRIIKREVKKCDLVLNHESVAPFSASFFALRYAKKFNKPFFTYVHSLDWELFTEVMKIPWIIRKIERSLLQVYGRWFLNNCTATLVSFPTIEKILRKIKIRGRFEIIPIGISNIFKPGKSKFSFNNKIVLGYAGRISKEKGLNVLLDSFLKLRSRFENIFLLIIGDGPLRRIFNDNLTDVKVTGFVSHEEVAEYFRAMDIFVLPSVTEANSLSTLEALKSGICCLTTDVGAIRDYLKNGYNGYLFKDEKELLDILEKLLKNGKLLKELRQNAGESVVEHTWENTVNCLIKTFEKY